MAGEPALSDYLPIPHATAPLTADPEQQHEETAQSLADAPTMSHALAVDDHDVKGEAQLSHNGEIKDLGWTDDVDQIVNPLVGGMPNQDLWVLIRRFNKVSWPVEAFGRVSRSSCHAANVSCQGIPVFRARRSGSQHCRRGGILPR